VLSKTVTALCPGSTISALHLRKCGTPKGTTLPQNNNEWGISVAILGIIFWRWLDQLDITVQAIAGKLKLKVQQQLHSNDIYMAMFFIVLIIRCV
jgi:hypothetical protein